MTQLVEWTKLPRGTHRYSQNGLTADVWQVAGRGWLWSVYDGDSHSATSGLIQAHNGIYQPSLDAACELALKTIETYREDSMTYECSCGNTYSRHVYTVCPECFAWPKSTLPLTVSKCPSCTGPKQRINGTNNSCMDNFHQDQPNS